MTKNRTLITIVAFSLFVFTVTQPGWGVEKVKTREKPMTTGDGLSMERSTGEVAGAGAVERVATAKPPTAKKKGLLTALLIGGAVLAVGVAVYLILAHASKSLDENFDDGQADGWATNGFGSWQVVSGVYTFTGSSWSYLQSYTASPALKYYPEWNTFKVTASGAGFTLFINGAQVGVVSDATLARGKIGFQIRNYAGAKAEYDDVRVTPN